MSHSISPNPFDNCPGYYLPDFYPYKSCTNISNFCEHAKDIYNIEMLLRWAIFVIPCCLSFFALFLNIYILDGLIPNLRRMNNRYRVRFHYYCSVTWHLRTKTEFHSSGNQKIQKTTTSYLQSKKEVRLRFKSCNIFNHVYHLNIFTSNNDILDSFQLLGHCTVHYIWNAEFFVITR